MPSYLAEREKGGKASAFSPFLIRWGYGSSTVITVKMSDSLYDRDFPAVFNQLLGKPTYLAIE